MVLSGLSHASVQVSDMDRSLRFYVDFLGLAVAIDRVETSRTELADGGSMDINRRAVYLRWDAAPSAGFVVLGQKFGAAPPYGDAAGGGLFGRGIDHIGLWCDDVDAFVACAPEFDAEILHGPAVYGGDYYGEVAPAQIRTVMFLDPDATVIQLDQRLTP